jgi:hypothetical protein
MYRIIRWSTRTAGAALGVLGLSLVAPMSLPTATAPGPHQGAALAATTTATSTAQAAGAASKTAATKYRWGKVVAGDEFNYRGKPKSSKWSIYHSRGHDGRGLRRASAWNVNGSVATVTGSTKGVTGGMSSRYNQKYGRWEARMKTNRRDAQYHPNILLWPQYKARSCPEVNFAESTNDTRRIKFFLHYGCKPSQTQASKVIDMTQWHNYAVEWTPRHITGYIDGVVWFRDTNRGHLPPGKMHASAQLDWFPSGRAPRVSTMSIDWMRIYKA